jgi:hypothetical protein
MNAAFLMNTNYFAARGTCPLVLFLFDEMSYADLLYVLKIINHAHSVVISVSYVEAVQQVAWAFPASGAVPQIASLEHITLFYPAQGSGLWLQTVIAPAPRARVLFPDKGAAEAAVHAAGCDQARSYRL